MSPICFPSHISWTCTLTEASKALCYMLYPPALLWLSSRSSIKAISNVTLFFRVGIKAGTFPGSRVFGSRWDPVFDSSEGNLQQCHQTQTLGLPCSHCFCNRQLFLMQFVDVEAFLQSRPWPGFPTACRGGGRQRASAPQSPASIRERLYWGEMGCAQALGTGLLPPLCAKSVWRKWARLPASLGAGSPSGQLTESCAITPWLVWGDACARATEQSARQLPAHARPEPTAGNWNTTFLRACFPSLFCLKTLFLKTCRSVGKLHCSLLTTNSSHSSYHVWEVKSCFHWHVGNGSSKIAEKTSKSSFFHKFLYLQDHSFQEGCYPFPIFTSHRWAAALVSHSHCTMGPCSAEAAGTVLDNPKLVCSGGGLASSSFSVSRHPEGCYRMLCCMRNLWCTSMDWLSNILVLLSLTGPLQP